MAINHDIHYNSPTEGWFHLEIEKTDLYKECLQWAWQREKKLQPETLELDEKLKRLDPNKFATFQKLESEVNMLLSKVNYGCVDSSEGSLAQEEEACKRNQLFDLAHKNMDMAVRPCKWKRRQWLSVQIWHCSEEEIRCKDKISKLETRIRQLKPEAVDVNTNTSKLTLSTGLKDDA